MLYHFATCYPRLGAHRAERMPALHAWARKPLGAFLRVARRARPRPWVYELLLDFRVAAHGKDSISALTRGYRFTGGAHGMPLLAGFTLAKGRLVKQPDGLFRDQPQARAALSAYIWEVFARRAASGASAWCFKDKRWLHEATAPTSGNYAIMALTAANGRATGLRLYFMPYQVAPSPSGIQTVDVPATRLSDWLKPDYRHLFGELPR